MKPSKSGHLRIRPAARRLSTKQSMLEQWKESQERLRIALGCANIGVFDWNVATNRVVFIRPTAALQDDILATREVDAAHWMATTHPDDIARARGEVDRAVNGETDGFAIRYRMLADPAKSNEWTVLQSRGQVQRRDARGRALRILGVFEVVTHLAAREELDRQRDAQLTRATQIAALGELASSLAHEINQPLATLAAYLQASARALKKSDSGNTELLATLRKCERQSQRVAEIVRRLRGLYSEKRVANEPCDLVACAHEVFHLLRREIEENNVRVSLACPHKKLVVFADRLQIEQVLYNVVRNAVDALRHYGSGRGSVSLSIRRTARRVRVRISDNGPGIPANIRHRMFEPFFTTKPNGTGLGLSISRSIVEAHRGRLDLDPKTKRGSAFIIELPTERSPK